MPQTAPLGFSTARPGLQSDGLTLSLTRPSHSARSFSSVAEVVAHSPAAIFLSVTLSRFDVTPAQQTHVADALSWLRRNPTALDRQLADQHLDSSAGRAVEAMLKRWVGSPQGVKLDCRVISESKAPAPLLAIIGAEVLGGTVKLIEGERPRIPPRPLCSDQHGSTDECLDGCVPAGTSLPPLFPALASFFRVRARRHYNLTPPTQTYQDGCRSRISPPSDGWITWIAESFLRTQITRPRQQAMAVRWQPCGPRGEHEKKIQSKVMRPANEQDGPNLGRPIYPTPIVTNGIIYFSSNAPLLFPWSPFGELHLVICLFAWSDHIAN